MKTWTQEEWEKTILANSKDAYSAGVIWSVIALCCGWISEIPTGHSGFTYGAFQQMTLKVFHLYQKPREEKEKMRLITGSQFSVLDEIRQYCEKNDWKDLSFIK